MPHIAERIDFCQQSSRSSQDGASKIGFSNFQPNLPPIDTMLQSDPSAVLLQQISILRATHHEHLATLREAHQKELAGHLAYIAFLERRSSSAHVSTPLYLTPLDAQIQSGLTIETSNSLVPLCELPTPDCSTATPHSLASSIQTAGAPSKEARSETQSPNVQLVQAPRDQMKSKRLSHKYQQVQQELEERNKTVTQLKDAAEQAELNERALRNAISALEAQLVSANNERLDALEGFHDVCQQLEQKKVVKTITTTDSPACRQPRSSNDLSMPSSSTADHTLAEVNPREQSRPELASAMARITALETELQSSRMSLQQKEGVIINLRKRQRDMQNAEAHNSARFLDLQMKLIKQEAALQKAEADRDAQKELLHAELLRQTQRPARRSHSRLRSADLQADVRLQGILADATFNADSVSCRADSGTSEASATLASQLELQLHHALRQTIAHKLELRDLKKDLKRACTDLRALQAVSTPRPLTPESEPLPDGQLATPDEHLQARDSRASQDGLGILLTPLPRPRAKTVDTATPKASKGTTSRSVMNIKQASSPSKSPLAVHKALPTPPAALGPGEGGDARPSIPALLVQRSETMRSLSDSIISSYAERSSPEQRHVDSAAVKHFGTTAGGACPQRVTI